MLAFLVPLDSPDPQDTYDGLRDEIRSYSEALFEKPHLVVLTKRDLLPADAEVSALDAPDAARIVTISSAAGMGLDDLKETLWSFVEETKRAAGDDAGEGDASDDGAGDDDDWRGSSADGAGLELDDAGDE